MPGALPEAELIGAFTTAGFSTVQITHRYDCFKGTTKERTAHKFGVVCVNVSGVRS